MSIKKYLYIDKITDTPFIATLEELAVFLNAKTENQIGAIHGDYHLAECYSIYDSKNFRCFFSIKIKIKEEIVKSMSLAMFEDSLFIFADYYNAYTIVGNLKELLSYFEELNVSAFGKYYFAKANDPQVKLNISQYFKCVYYLLEN